MSRKRKLSNVKERCRICLTDDGYMSKLFDEVLQSKLQDLLQCTSINLKDEHDLPNIICHVCLYKLDMWSEFKKQFMRSNQILLNQLELEKVPDNVNSELKRSHNDLQQSGGDSLSDTPEKKKVKTDIPPLIPLEFANVDSLNDQNKLKEICISEDDVTSPKDSSQKIHDISNEDESKNDEESQKDNSKNDEGNQRDKPKIDEGNQKNKFKNDEGDQKDEDNDTTKIQSASSKIKSLTGKRSRTTEQREASTKRWVARKRALLAATGGCISDTDSLASDDTQLSPVQKARIKTNMDKELEKQKRLSRVVKSLQINMTDKYTMEHEHFISMDTDADIRRTRSLKDMNSDVCIIESKNTPKILSIKKDVSSVHQVKMKKDKAPNEDLKEKENSPVLLSDKNVTEKLPKKLETQIPEDTFAPCCVKSELEIGDATYIVTSTLMLAEPHYLNKPNLFNLSKQCRNGSIERNSQEKNIDLSHLPKQCRNGSIERSIEHSIEQNPPEKNTDIIDAVQLRRVNPIPTDTNGKKCVERCLNIEIEGTEIDALKRVQVELADFVEKEMKHRLFGTGNDSEQKDKEDNSSKGSYQTLDRQLKNIIEKTIKKNFESSMIRSCNSGHKSKPPNSGTVSAEFVKEAMNSNKFQPKVLLKRLDATKEKKQDDNNVQVTSKRTVKNKLSGPFSIVAHKRQIIPPIRYSDYNTSALDSESTLSDEVEVSEISMKDNESTEKLEDITKGEGVTKKQVEEIKILEPNTVLVRGSVAGTERKVENEGNNSKVVSLYDEKHICGVCEQSFNSREEVAAHVRTHKTETSVQRSNKHRMMRCKRCHEIVEARFVKAHVCKSTKQVHKCYVCNSTFRTEKLLNRHLESHDQSEFNIENITKIESQKPSTHVSPKETLYLISEDGQVLQAESSITVKTDNVRVETNNGKSEKTGATKGVERPKETYTCFVCDKIFTDEEILKDHLQKHCDDMSEDDQSTGKEQYQCAICGDSLDSEDALEAHVEKHLFDEEDDNPNLINIANENDKAKDDPYRCLQCAETFNSEMLLEMHMQAHEEEAAIAEWEKQGIKAYEYQCMICDDLFETEEELSEHLDIHNGNSHVCQLCDKPFQTLEELQKHVATH